MRLIVPTMGVAILVAAHAGVGHAQPHSDYLEIEVPAEILDERIEGTQADDGELDLANVVRSATRGVTTVQEAPAIVTVVTSEEIAARHLTSLEQIIDGVPGWMRLGGLHNQFPLPLARGQPQAALFLHDGLSLFDPALNVPAANRVQPVETIARVELVTGPGGVLWGANALLGIINVITKDAGDVDGVEANVTLGDGNGDRSMFRAYVMAGAPGMIGDKVDGFFHASFESFRGPGFAMPAHLLSTSLPQPNSADFYGPLTRGDPARSYIVNLSGKLTVGDFEVRAQAPFVERHTALSFDGGVVREHLPEDSAVDPETGELLCPETPPFDDPADACADRARLNRDNQTNFLDRYLVAEYKRRTDDGLSGVSFKGYAVNFVRRIGPFFGGAPLHTLLEGGISFDSPIEAYRAGVAIDGDVAVRPTLRLLWGAEAFHEWLSQNSTGSRQGAGVQSRFNGPFDLTQLPLPCPRQVDAAGEAQFVPGCPLTMAFEASRTVLGAYVDAQWRPRERLIVDAGARLQVAPAPLGIESYDLTPSLAGALVYRLAPSWHVKLNVAQGFRPPIFNNTASNGEAIQIDGDSDLEVETSTAGQAELNARIFKGERSIRELSFRADYSYTYLHNLIQIVSGRYQNTADRGLHSAELLAKLYVKGGHHVELGYTWLQVDTADVGRHRSLPEHWFNLGAVVEVKPDVVAATATLRVRGAMEDPNRVVDYRGYEFDDVGRVIRTDSGMPEYLIVSPSELVLDRLPPVADLTLGLTWQAIDDVQVTATVHNALNARYYQPDAFFSYEPRVEFLPNPTEDRRAYISATYRH